MKFIKKKIISFLLFAIYFSVCHGQTYVGVGFGYDYTQIIKGTDVQEGPMQLHLEKDKYSAGSYLGSIMIEQQLSKRKYLSLNLSLYTKKDAPATWTWVATPAKSLRINLFRVKTLFRQEITSGVHMGLGLGIGFNSVRVVFASGKGHNIEEIIPNNISYDSHFVVGYNYKHFLLELGYQKGMGYQKDYSYFVEPMNSFSLTMSYLFKISKKNKKRSENVRF